MDCLSPEQMARYLRGGGTGESRALEAHVRDCPACAVGLLLARETLHELKAKGARPATDRMRPVRLNRPAWVPWVAAAAVILAAILAFTLRTAPPEAKPQLAPRTPPPHAKPEMVQLPEKPVEPPRKPEVKPDPEPPLPRPEAPPRPKPELPELRPQPKSKPEPEPVKPPEPPKTEPPPKKPAPPTLVERAVVARVLRAVGGSAQGKTLLVGDTFSTGRQEFVEVSLDGFGSLYFRENSRAELGAGGEINLVDGEILARIDAGRRLGAVKTPSAEVEIQAPLFAIQVNKMQTEVFVADGRAAIGSIAAKGPQAILAKAGKSPELRPLDAGFASWIPEKLAAKKFSGWFEGESFALQGFKAMDRDLASGGKAAVQTAEQATATLKTSLPFKGRYAIWFRVRNYEAKATTLGLHLNGQAIEAIKIDPDKAPWRWVGPLAASTDRIDLTVAALSRFPLSTQERNSFPVTLDVVYVTNIPSDGKALAPPEKLPEERRAFDFAVDEPK